MNGRGFRVRRPGLLTTVQDLGRWGFQDRGMAVAGAMDDYSHRAANLLVGNPPDAATLEITAAGPELEFDTGARAAVCGAAFALTVDGGPRSCHLSFEVPAGGVLAFGPRGRGMRAYLAVRGGIDVPAVLGSRATHLPSRVGGIDGRALKRDDWLPIGDLPAVPAATPRPLPLPEGSATLRVMPGPHHQRFPRTALAQLTAAEFRISPQSSRTGYRLEGAPLAAAEGELLSAPTPAGGVQVPPSGEPIVLMADRGTTGGYPILATVIGADLPIAGQLAPGDVVRFTVCAPGDAVAARRARDAVLRGR